MKILGLLLILIGIWFLASSATTEGLLPSGHGTGRVSEIIEGLALIGLGICRLGTKGARVRATPLGVDSRSPTH